MDNPCVNHPAVRAVRSIQTSLTEAVAYCYECYKKFQENTGTEFRCKHCKVPVIDKIDLRPILGRTHGKHCPRRVRYR